MEIQTVLEFLRGQDWQALEFTGLLAYAVPVICSLSLVRWFFHPEQTSNALVLVATGAFLLLR